MSGTMPRRNRLTRGTGSGSRGHGGSSDGNQHDCRQAECPSAASAYRKFGAPPLEIRIVIPIIPYAVHNIAAVAELLDELPHDGDIVLQIGVKGDDAIGKILAYISPASSAF